MPIFNADITGVDTVGIRAASEAFISSDVTASPVSEGLSPTELADALAVEGWGTDPLNSALLVVCTLAGIVCLPRLIKLAPLVWGGLFHWKHVATIYKSVRLMRARNILTYVSVLPLCLLASRYSLFRTFFMEEMPYWAVTLCIIGAFSIYWSIRGLIAAILPNYIRGDECKIARSNAANGIIIISLTSLACAGACAMLGISSFATKVILNHLIPLLFFIIFYRNWQILSWKGQRFKAFLYLCALELVPAGLLVAGTVIF